MGGINAKFSYHNKRLKEGQDQEYSELRRRPGESCRAYRVVESAVRRHPLRFQIRTG